MNVICSICSDQLIQSDDIFYTRCGHVFHLHCLTSWLERSKSCPQCREKVTQSKIHRLYFTFSSNDLIVETQGSTLQEKVDRLKFQILLKEKDIQYYSSKNVTLEKQNAGLKQEVRKVESEINKKNAAIHALKEQINYFKEQSSHCDNLKREISQLKNKIEDLRPIQVLLHAPISDVSKMVGKTKDPQTLTMYISIMKKELIGRFNKCKQLRMSVKKLQEELSKVNTKSDTSLEQSKRMDLEEKLAFSESKNIALQKRVNELEEILDINEQSNSKLEIQIAEDVNNISIKNPTEKTSKKHSQDISNKNSILNCSTKQKTEKICNAKTIQQKIQDCQADNDTSDLELDLIDCNSSKNSSIEFKRFKLSEDDINVSHTSHNNKSSNSSISKKRKKNNTKKKVSDIEDEHESSVIDLTWFEFHKKLMLLNQQSVLEISGLREESTKEWFVSFKKIPVLIYEAIQIDIWKHKVFPLLIEINEEPKNTFMLYTVFYHEDIAVSLLENVLFHCESAETINDSALDLVDYAVKSVSLLLDMPVIEIYENVRDPNSCLEEIFEKKKEFEFDIGIRCISILRYLAEYVDNLPLCVLSRLLATHDVPYLLAELIERHPWKKESTEGENMIYNSGWRKVKSGEEGKISKIEGQVWLGLRELLLNTKSAPYYEITDHRFSQLLKLQKYLHECVLDQISPLIDLKRWLNYLSVSSPNGNALRAVNVELIPQIKSSIIEKYHKKWKKLAKHQSKFIYTTDVNYIKNAAQILSDAYDLDKLDCIDVKECPLCHEEAKKRCSKCKEVWYCGRECQVKDWVKHKNICDKITKNMECEKD